MINVDLKLFRAVIACASTEETRYYLNGVYVQKHPVIGALLVATDGHRMMVAHDETGECVKPGIVSAEKPMLAALVRAKTGRLIVRDDGEVFIEDLYRSPKSGLIDGTFPDWSRIIIGIRDTIKAGKHGAASYNAAYLKEFSAIASVLSLDKKPVILRVVAFAGSEPALVLFPGCDAAFGVLMPMRVGEDLNALPLFMQPVLEPKKKTKRAVPAKTTAKKPAAAPKRKAA